MILISNEEFANNTEKYFDLAINEDVCIEYEGDMFVLTFINDGFEGN